MGHPKRPTSRRPPSRVAGDRETRALAATLGGEVRRTRLVLGLTQQQVADQVAVSRTRIAEIERGLGRNVPLETWVSLGLALGRPVALGLSRSTAISETSDAGHLGAQECVLRLARANRRETNVELSVGKGWRPRSIDVVQRDRPNRTLIVNEIWNRLDDLGAALRNHDLKVADAERLALMWGSDGGPFRVTACWVLRATAANRALVGRYPEVFRTRFPGSSRRWVRSLQDGDPAPPEPGLVWIDLASTRLREVRLSAGR